MKHIIALVAVLLPGLASAGNFDRIDATQMDDAELCGEYGTRMKNLVTVGPWVFRGGFAFGHQFDALVVEIKRRNLIRQEQIIAVLTHIPVPGMTAVEALCAWGRPDRTEKSGSQLTWFYETAKSDINQRSLVVSDDVVEAVSY